MTYTFMKVLTGMTIGDSLFDAKGAEIVPRIAEKARAKAGLMIPADFVIRRPVRAGMGSRRRAWAMHRHPARTGRR